MEDIDIIKKSIDADKRTQRMVSIALLIIGAAIFYFSSEATINRGLVFFVGGIFILLALVFLLQSFFLFKSGDAEILDILKDEPEKIVWVYPYITQTMPYGVSVANKASLIFKSTDNKSYNIKINKQAVDKLMNLLRQRLSTATFGYSKEKEFLYSANPLLLKKSD